ncbi:transcriptional regulator [Candidatus Pelagibacter communis]|uniref:transcriptional regulator n=1 Tax=Pelagibacter ubique TaxID=198252 RepID=UPI00092CF584|nr:transcriptional regulator [Candidatus Pelagibacter ubique]
MNTLPSISARIDEKTINKVIQDNFGTLASSFFTLTSNWFVRAYEHYKDIDKFVIIIYLINQDLIYFRQYGIKIDYDTFYKDKSIEISKINISDISKDLGIPKESIRRKVVELENEGTIKRTGKKIFVVRDTLYSARATNTLTEIATILHEFNKILKKEKLTTEVFSVDEIISAMKENFSYCWYQFNKFWFDYMNRWRAELKDLEYLAIGMVVIINAVKNKEFTPKNNIRSYHKALMGSDTRGVNAMSVSEITGIPRPTVVRKLKYLIDKKYLHINEKKLIIFDAKDSAFQKTSKMINQNMLSLSNFIYKVFNQIRIINT